MAYTATAADGSHRPMTREEKKVIFASSLGTVFEWYDFYLYGSLSRGDRRAVLLGREPDRGLHLRADGLRGRLRGAAVRRAVLRPARRHDRPQVHLPRHHHDHGPVDLHRRHPAQLRLDRHRRAGDPDLPAAAAGPGARRRVRRRRDLRRRARAARQARRLHLVDPDDGDARPVPVAAGDPRLPRLDVARGLRRLGLAHPVPGVDRAARGLGLDPADAEREPGLPEDEGRGHHLEGAADRVVRPVEEPEGRAAGAVRPRRRPGGGLVHRPVLRAVLPDPDAEGRRLQRQPDDRRRAAARHAVLRDLRHALRPHRTQADHHARPAAGLPHLLPDLQGHHPLRQPGASRRRSPRRRSSSPPTRPSARSSSTRSAPRPSPPRATSPRRRWSSAASPTRTSRPRPAPSPASRSATR